MAHLEPTEVEKQNRVHAYVRPQVAVHLGIECITDKTLLRGILKKGVEPEPFDPKRTYRVRSFVPTNNNPLYWVFREAPVLMGISLLQVRREDEKGRRQAAAKEEKAEAAQLNGKRPPMSALTPPQTPDGLLTSCTVLTKVTPWMHFLHLSPAIVDAMELDLDIGEPIVARIWPPRPRELYLEAIVEFRKNGATLYLSRIADSGAQDRQNSRLTICPPDAQVRAYLTGLSKRQRFNMRGTVYDPPRKGKLRVPTVEPFKKIEQQPTPAEVKAQKAIAPPQAE